MRNMLKCKKDLNCLNSLCNVVSMKIGFNFECLYAAIKYRKQTYRYSLMNSGIQCYKALKRMITLSSSGRVAHWIEHMAVIWLFTSMGIP